MPEIFEKLSLFFDKIKNITFWDRVLPWRWRTIAVLGYEAYSEYCRLVALLSQSDRELEQGRTSIATLQPENERLKIKDAKSEKEIEQLKLNLENERNVLTDLRRAFSVQEETLRQYEKDAPIKQTEINRLKEKAETLSQNNSSLKEELASFKESEANRLKQYENKIATLDSTQKRIENERALEVESRHLAELKRIAALREKWGNHQNTVKETIKVICQKYTIEYIEKPPFRGDPDNTLKICDEFVIFDAKSPGTDDLKSFPKYINTQAEAIKKYAGQENVKRDVFLVVPFDTMDVIERFSFNMGAYYVYVVTVDALEPIIVTLKKIETYEFVKELTPEERENVCRIIGTFAHTAKRRIQIDHFFARQFLDVLTKCERDIPRDLFEKVEEFERAEKLNPAMERRAKQILSKELVRDMGKIQQEAEAKEMVFPEAIEESLNAIPLYKKEKLEN